MNPPNIQLSKFSIMLTAIIIFYSTFSYSHYLICDGDKYNTEIIPIEVSTAYKKLYNIKKEETCFIANKFNRLSEISNQIDSINFQIENDPEDIDFVELKTKKEALEKKFDSIQAEEFPGINQRKLLEQEFDKINYLEAKKHCIEKISPRSCPYQYENIKDNTFRLRSCVFQGSTRKFASCSTN